MTDVLSVCSPEKEDGFVTTADGAGTSVSLLLLHFFPRKTMMFFKCSIERDFVFDRKGTMCFPCTGSLKSWIRLCNPSEVPQLWIIKPDYGGEDTSVTDFWRRESSFVALLNVKVYLYICVCCIPAETSFYDAGKFNAAGFRTIILKGRTLSFSSTVFFLSAKHLDHKQPPQRSKVDATPLAPP